MSTGYGTDMWCTDGLQTGRLVSGWRLVAQALYRRVTTPRGTLQWGDEEAAYGIDLAGYVGTIGYDTAIKALPGIVRGEWLKDDRVSDARITATSVRKSDGTMAITLDATVTLADESGDFDMTLNVSSGGVQLLLSQGS